MAEAFTHLGFSDYFRVQLALAKLLGVILLLAPVPARLKEWAYAGFAITLGSALIAHLSVGDGPEAWGWAAGTGVRWGAALRRASPTSIQRSSLVVTSPGVHTMAVKTPKSSAAKRIEKAIADLGDWRGERLAEIRRIIHEVDPAVVEEWKWMGTPVWSHEGMYALANAHKDKVKLTFHHGAQLRDPKKLFNAGLEGNKWRAIDFREGDRIDKTALKALLREAIAYNATHSVPKSKGSRP